MANKPENLKPFNKGYDVRRYTKQKGDTSFKTDLNLAMKEVAQALRLGEKPNKMKVQLIITGLKEALKGNYAFWNKFMEAIYEEMREKKGLDVTTAGKPIPPFDYVNKGRNNNRNGEDKKANQED